jgi:hypothetical protein
MDSISKEELLEVLSKNEVEVEFTKKDGTVRFMKCTRNVGLIPEDKHPKGVMDPAVSDNIRVFDLQLSEWRSFNYESVKSAAWVLS